MEKNERRGWTLVAVFLLLGLLCVIVAGNLAIQFAPRWSLQADMRSRLEPDSAYLTSQPGYVLQPIDPAILTPPIWINVFLTPGQTIPTRLPKPTVTPTKITAPTQGPSTVTPTASPTPVLVYFTTTHTSAPASTATGKPPIFPATPSPVPTNPPRADLQITISSGQITYAAGGTLTYAVVVSNKGPNDITGAIVTDNIPAQLSDWSWVCSAQTGGVSGCLGMTGKNNFINTLSLPAGSNLTYTVNATISGDATGDLTNSASVTLPAPAVDPELTNNVSGSTLSPGVDLQITKSDGASAYTPGGTVTYTVVATNNSTFNVSGAVVTDELPSSISRAVWQCVPDAGAVCTPGGTGSIQDTVTLPPGLRITYTITIDISPFAIGALTNAASVAAPAGFIDTATSNNRAEDTNAAGSGEPDIGPPNGSWLSIPPGTALTMVMSRAIVADGDAGVPDFVFYERLAAPTNIEMDWVQVDISADGNVWYQVLYWGDPAGSPDINTIVDVMNLIGDLCPTEVDNCVIPKERLYNATGITIDIDTIVPPGKYPWIRVVSPIGGGDDSEVDSIQPYYP